MVYDYERCGITFHSPFRSLRRTFALKCGCETYPSSRKTSTELRPELGINGGDSDIQLNYELRQFVSITGMEMRGINSGDSAIVLEL